MQSLWPKRLGFAMLGRMSKKFETPKGTRDFLPQEMRLRSAVFERLRRAFSLFGYDELDTPVFEYLDVLTLKAGPQAENEIYAFDDKGGRRLGLRFDLTSSTGRVAANHPELKRPLYRYQIGKVWRYDRPAAGRYREFYQADADIIGSDSMNCEVELFLLADHVLRDFGLQESLFLLNNRKVLDAYIRVARIDLSQKSAALRALDKLDKIGRDGVIEEAVRYGISKDSFVNFLNLLGISGDRTLQLDNQTYLQHASSVLGEDEQGRKGLEELQSILQHADALGFANRLRLDPTLARGLDYYTGPIFEARAGFGQGLLSFAGGGRYDDLVGLYGGQSQGAVGFSFGVERLIELVKEQSVLQATPPPALVAPLHENQRIPAQQLGMQLRQAGVATRLSVHAAGPGKHIQYAESTGIAWVIFVGEQEAKENRFAAKHLPTRTEYRGTPLELVEAMGRKLQHGSYP